MIVMHLPVRFGTINIFIQTEDIDIFGNSIWRSPPRWILTISKFRTLRHDDSVMFELCTKFRSNICLYLNENHPIAMKFGTQEHILVLDDGHVIKYEHLKLKMADARHFKNSFLAMSIV